MSSLKSKSPVKGIETQVEPPVLYPPHQNLKKQKPREGD